LPSELQPTPYAIRPLADQGTGVGLFADKEIGLLKGLLFVGEDYELEREVVAPCSDEHRRLYETAEMLDFN
jgi:hypothetical protein